MKKNITVIITLYKTPIEKLKALNQYKNYKVIIFAQDEDKYYKDIIKKNSKIKFKYFFSKSNIGLSKATNYMISKVKTKYFLFTQPDIFIDEKSIENLKNAFKYRDNLIFTGPSFKRKREKGFQIKTQSNYGYLELEEINTFNEYNISKLMKRCSICINLIGILYEKKKNNFNLIHSDLPSLLSKLAKENSIKQFIHI